MSARAHADRPRPGLALARDLYSDHVAPLLRGTPHAAALLGEGSEVLGFDDEVSTDHDFRTRVQIFVESPSQLGDVERAATVDSGEVEVALASEFFAARLGFDPESGVTLADWLLTPTQRFATLTRGVVLHDPDGMLSRRREAIQWYPHDVWRYVLAAAWLRISQHEAFLGRAGARGDEVGSALVGARLAHDVMRLAFLIERTWAPYDKWLGTDFARLEISAVLDRHLTRVLDAKGWREREAALGEALSVAAAATNALGLCEPVDPSTRQYFTRDIRVLGGSRFTGALIASIEDPQVTRLIARVQAMDDGGVQGLPGAVDQVTDNVDVLAHVDRCRALAPVLGLS